MKTILNIFQIGSRRNSVAGVSPVSVSSKRSDFMRKDLSAIGFGLVLSGLAVVSSFAADPATVALHGHVPAIVARGNAQAIGRLAPDTVLDLSIGLPVRNREALAHLTEQVSDPKSPNYGQYLTREQFTARFGPTEQDYQAVINFARAHGLTVTHTHANRMLLNVTGKAADIEKAFGVTLHEYQHPTEARTFFAPDVEPSVPAGLAIQDVSGLDSYRRPHPNYRLKPGQTFSKSVPSAETKSVSNVKGNATTGSGPSGDYVGDDFRNAYVPGTFLNGFGQTIALVQFDGYLASDIAEYESLFNRTNIPLTNVLIDGFSGAPTGNGGEVEVSLDIEMCISMAPALAEVILYEGSPFNFHPNDVLNQIAVDDSARQVSCSWGWTGGPNATTDQIFQEMIVQGQTFFHASGDSDAFLPGEVDNPNNLFEPSSSPFITQVGGTTLTMNGTGASYASETVWNWDIRYGTNADGIGSCGGISSFYSIPSWQSNINMTLPQGSQTHRNIPDVALTADDVLVIADAGTLYIGTGGTSCASPLWAGFTALVNQQAATFGHAMGFINPALYNLATGTNYNNCFHDIVTDNNEWSLSPNLFSAVTNYDLCTGLGTPNGTNLINALVVQATNALPVHISPPPPPYGTTMSAVSGGNPNGTWSVFIQDDTPVNSGYISNGWVLSLTLADIVGTTADLEIYMGMTNNTVFVGQPITFFLAVTNYGPSISTNVQVVDNLPTSVSVVATNATQGTVLRSGSTLVWNVGTLAMNAGAGLVLTVQTHSVGSFANSADSQASTPDPNPDDDEVSTNFSVVTPSVTLAPSFVASTHTFQINVPGPTNPTLTVVIQANSNLVSTNWVNVYTGVPPFIFTDPAGSNVDRFYRALLLP